MFKHNWPSTTANNLISKLLNSIDRNSRYVMSSNGHKEKRYVIATDLIMGERIWPIELTLSNRDPLQYRMLLGREALAGHTLIGPKNSFCL